MIEKIKETLKDLRIVQHDIKVCIEYKDFEDMGFYQQRRSDLEKELIEQVEELIKELENEDKQ